MIHSWIVPRWLLHCCTQWGRTSFRVQCPFLVDSWMYCQDGICPIPVQSLHVVPWKPSTCSHCRLCKTSFCMSTTLPWALDRVLCVPLKVYVLPKNVPLLLLPQSPAYLKLPCGVAVITEKILRYFLALWQDSFYHAVVSVIVPMAMCMLLGGKPPRQGFIPRQWPCTSLTRAVTAVYIYTSVCFLFLFFLWCMWGPLSFLPQA